MLDKSVLLLNCVASGKVTLAELVEVSGLSRATAHRLAVGLEGHGLLRRTADGRFALGLHLAWLGGMLPLSGGAVALAWAVCLYWFCVVLVLFVSEGKPVTITLSKIDFYFRIVVVLVILSYATSVLVNNPGSAAGWAAWKLVVFAALVSCGIAIRIHLKPFLPAFIELMSKGASETGNRVMERSIANCRPFVWCIWAGLLLNTALGIHLFG